MGIFHSLRPPKQQDASARLVLRTIPEDKSFQNLLPSSYRKRRLPSTRKGKIIRRASIGLATVILGLALSFSGGIGASTGSRAQASIASTLGLCDKTSLPGADNKPIAYDSSGNANSGIQFPDSSSSQDTTLNTVLPLLSTLQENGKPAPITAYQWFGENGQSWTNYNYEAFPGYTCLNAIGTVGNLIANFLFTVDKLVATVAASLFGWMRSLDAFKPFLHTINDLFVGNGGGNGGLVNNLFLTFLTPIVFAGAMYMAWVGLVKKRSSQAIQSAIWMIGASAAALVFLLHPVGLATLADSGVSYVSNDILQLLIGTPNSPSIANSSSAMPAGDLCYSNHGWRTAQCDIWEVFIYSPWKNGQFGSVGDSALTNLAPKGTAGLSDKTITNGFSLPGNPAKFNSLSMLYLYAYAQNSDDASIAYNKYSPSPQKVPSGYTGVSDATRMSVANGIYQSELSLSSVDPADVSAFTGEGNAWGHRVSIAFLDFLAMLFAAVPILLITFNIIILQLGLVIIMIMAPFFLTAGIYPGFGRKLTMTWLEMLLSNCLKRIGNTFVLGILLFMLETIVNLQGITWAIQLVFIVASTFGILAARSKIVNSLSNVSLGGNGVRSSEQIDQGIRKGLKRFTKGTATTVKDAMYFEGGYKKGARNSLLTRSKWAAPLVAAGEDVKKMRDPLRAAKQQVATTQKKKNELLANQKLMDATASDKESMEVWRKVYNRTREPVPYPSGKQEEIKAWSQTQQNARKILETPVPANMDANRKKADDAKRAKARNDLNISYPIDKDKAKWLQENNIPWAKPPYGSSNYVPVDEVVPVTETVWRSARIPVEEVSKTKPDFSLTREAKESVLFAEKETLISERDSMSNEISRVVTALRNFTQELNAGRDSMSADQIDRLEISMQVNHAAENQFREAEERINARIREIDTEVIAWAEVDRDVKNTHERLQRPKYDLGLNEEIKIPDILEIPMPNRTSSRTKTSDEPSE